MLVYANSRTPYQSGLLQIRYYVPRIPVRIESKVPPTLTLNYSLTVNVGSCGQV
jgi:hypothetical protein